MRDFELKFMSTETAESIRLLCDEYIGGKTNLTAEQLFERINTFLPFDRMQRTTVLQRIEGLHFASEILWNRVIETQHLKGEEVVKKAKLKPLSHFHYITISSVPRDKVKTRDDYYNDPPTALAKLKDDILKLAGIVCVPEQ